MGLSRPRHLAVLTALLVLLIPAAASAHATLESSSPPNGALVKQQPSQVVFRFDESVEGNFGAVQVYDSTGERVDEGDAFHPDDQAAQIAVHLKPDLPEGSYTATYRVISADGHVVTSGYVFSVGKRGQPASVADLLDRSKTGAPTQIAFGAARAIQYGAIALFVGALLFFTACWLPAMRLVRRREPAWDDAAARYGSRTRRILIGAAVAGFITAVASIALEGAEAAGISGWSALRPHVLSEVLGTRFGTVWGIAAACWLIAGLLIAGLPRRAALLALVLPSAFLVAAPSLGGHGLTQDPVGILLPSIVAHAAAMCAWLGGLVVLLLAVPAGTRALAPADRSRLLAAVLERFSPIALFAVVVLLATGLLQSYIEIRDLDLVFSTGFGRAAFIKLVLLVGLVAVGAINQRRTMPRLAAAARGQLAPGAAGLVLRRALRAEVALLVVVLGVTGALASYPPSIAQGTGPANVRATLGPALLQMTVDPAKPGANTMHVYLTNPKTGAQFTRFESLTVTATLPSKGIGPIALQATKTGPGHYTIAGAFLTAAGDWQLRVTLRLSQFDEAAQDVPVKISG